MSDALRCDFCWHMCELKEGQRGICGIREHRDNHLVTRGWGDIVAQSIDPIEKKPMYHFLPGARTFSCALFGCNYTCSFCQNYAISQKHYFFTPSLHRTPEQLVEDFDCSGSPIMSYTYSDPVVWQDYMLEAAQLVHARGKLNCMVTNGSFSNTALERVLPAIDAFNIDVKGDDAFYRTYCSGSLRSVLDSVECIAADSNTVLEVTTLIIEEVHTEAMIRLIAEQLVERGVNVWHLSRFFPQFRMKDYSQTSDTYLQRMLAIAKEAGIPYVYAGNSALTAWDCTICPSCKTVLIHSHSYTGEAAADADVHIVDGRCSTCGYPIYGRFNFSQVQSG